LLLRLDAGAADGARGTTLPVHLITRSSTSSPRVPA
jgi:hypothetical protein